VYIGRKIIPTDEYWKKVINKLAEYKRIERANYELNKIIKMFVEGGFVLTEEDVLYALEYKLIIENIENYGVNITQKMIDKCNEKHIIGYLYNDKLTLIEKVTLLLLDKDKLSEVKNIVKKEKVELDLKCLQNACLSGNSNSVKFVLKVNKNIKPDVKCLQDVINNNKKSRQLIILRCLIERM